MVVSVVVAVMVVGRVRLGHAGRQAERNGRRKDQGRQSHGVSPGCRFRDFFNRIRVSPRG
jgi:hypothetical protein